MEKLVEKYGRDAIFPTRLRWLMEKYKITQQELAIVCGVQRQSVSLWYNGITRPDILALVKIAEYLNVSTDYLLGFTECRRPNNPELVSYCAELEQRVDLLLKKSEAFNEILSSIESILSNYVSEYDFLVRFKEVDDGNSKVDKNHN